MIREERDFKGIWIPKEIWLSQDLKLIEKIFFVEIDSLDNEHGCWASNKYFSEFFEMTRQRCSQIINSLIDKGYITCSFEYEGKEISKRTLRVSKKFSKVSKKIDTVVKKFDGGCQEKFKDNNTLKNNTSNNFKGGKKICFDDKKLKELMDVWTGSGLPKLDWETAVLMLTEQAVEHINQYDIAECIRNYSKILNSTDHHYTYKWMFWSFLDKGFKKFLPQCNPQEAFRNIKAKEDTETEEDKLKRIREAMK